MADDKAEVVVDATEVGDAARGFKLEQFPPDIRPLMADFDLDNSGEISASELAFAAKLLREAQDSNKKLKRLAFVISSLLLLTLGTIFGLVWAVVSALKDNEVDPQSGTMTIKGTNQLVMTSSMKQTTNLADMITGMTADNLLEALDQFTVLGKTAMTVQVTGFARSVPDAAGMTSVTLFTSAGPLRLDAQGYVYSDNPLVHDIFQTNATTDALNEEVDPTQTGPGRRLAGSTPANAGSTDKYIATKLCKPGEGSQSYTPGKNEQGNRQCFKCALGSIMNEGIRSKSYDVMDFKAGVIKESTKDQPCAFCAPWSIAPKVGSTDCTLCPPGQLADATRTKCVDPDVVKDWDAAFPAATVKASGPKGDTTFKQWKKYIIDAETSPYTRQKCAKDSLVASCGGNWVTMASFQQLQLIKDYTKYLKVTGYDSTLPEGYWVKPGRKDYGFQSNPWK